MAKSKNDDYEEAKEKYEEATKTYTGNTGYENAIKAATSNSIFNKMSN